MEAKMAYLVVLIVDDPDNCPAILESWETLGVRGVTILESTGLGRLKRSGLRDDMPLMPSLRDILESNEEHHRTLLSVVDDEQKVDEMIAAAQRITGDLDRGNTGFLFVVPVLRVHGLGSKRPLR
jgi:nitrogen regulatory protein PII